MASQNQLDDYEIEMTLTKMKNSDIVHLNHKAIPQKPTSAKAVMPMRIIKVVFARILMQSFPCVSEACSVLHCGSGFFISPITTSTYIHTPYQFTNSEKIHLPN